MNLKKIISVCLALVMVLTLAACGNSGDSSKGPSNSTEGDSGKVAEEIGLWGYESIELNLDKLNEGVDEALRITEDEVETYKAFYDMFLAAMYFEFKDDGTGSMRYIEEEDSQETAPEPFKWSNGKFDFDNKDDAIGMTIYECKDGKLVIPVEENGITLTFKKCSSLDEVKSNMDEIVKMLQELING